MPLFINTTGHLSEFLGPLLSDKNKNVKLSNSAYNTCTLENGNRHGFWAYLAEACFRRPMVSLSRAREKEKSAK